MALADTNVWLALTLSGHPFHDIANDWFASQTSNQSALFCRATQQSFLHLLTTEALMGLFEIPPMNNADAWSVYVALRADHRIGFAFEPPDIESTWQAFAARNTASPKLWMDSYLAAFAVAGDQELITTDTAFRQFKGLRLTVLTKSASPS